MHCKEKLSLSPEKKRRVILENKYLNNFVNFKDNFIKQILT